MQRCYQCSDGRWIIVMMPFREEYYWPRFTAALGKPAWAAPGSPWDSGSKRYRGRGKLSAEVASLIATAGTMSEWLARFEEHGCIAGPIATLPEVCEDPQLRANGAFEKVVHEQTGYEFETVAAPFNIHGADVRVRGPGPEVGEHTDAVLQQHLPSLELERLRSAGVIGAKLRPGTAIANWSAKL